MSKILVTGGAGLIGHNVVSVLEQQGHTVEIIDNHTNYGFIPRAEVDYLIRERKKKHSAKEFTFDIVNSISVQWKIAQFSPDIVIHLASFPRQKAVQMDPSYGARVMCEGLTNLLEASVKNEVKKFIYISSSMVYGDFITDVTESAVCNPIGQYGIFKYMGEKLVQDYSSRTDMQHLIIRPSAVYGPLDVEDRVVSKFILAAMRGETLKVKGPDEVLDFSYVEDVALGIVQATLSNYCNKIYNLTYSSEKQYSLLDAAKLAISIAGSGDIEIGPRDMSFPKRGRLSTLQARTDFGFNPTVTVEQGFQKYYEWLSTSSYYTKM